MSEERAPYGTPRPPKPTVTEALTRLGQRLEAAEHLVWAFSSHKNCIVQVGDPDEDRRCNCGFAAAMRTWREAGGKPPVR